MTPFLLMFSPFFVAVIVLFCHEYGNPFSAAGRGKREYLRRLGTRKGELMARGYDPVTASIIAKRDLELEAIEITNTLKKEGVEA